MERRNRAERRLAQTLMEERPSDAAAAIEGLPPREAGLLLTEVSAGDAAAILGWMVPADAAAALGRMPLDASRDCVTALSARSAAAILRRSEPAVRERLLEALPSGFGAALQSLLTYPDATAGALMDPEVLTLPVDVDVREARGRVMKHASEAHYNLYVIERGGRLAGVLNLRELFAGDERQTVAALMNEATHRIHARADRLEVITHGGWKHVHSLPVVDEEERFLGAIRFRTLREVEEEVFRRAPGEGASAGRALGELYWTGLSGMLDAIVAAVAPHDRSSEDTSHGRAR